MNHILLPLKGLTLIEGPLYTITLHSQLFIASAVLDTKTVRGKAQNIVQLWLRQGKKDHLFAVINNSSPYIVVGLKFDVREIVGFYMKGKGQVYLSGYAGSGIVGAVGDKDGIPPQVTTDQTIPKSENALAKNQEVCSSGNDSTCNINNQQTNGDVLAKIGDQVSIYYECLLHPQNEILISHKSGDPYQFTLGDATICSGMNNAIVGMKVEEMVRTVCPPEIAYGANGIPTLIPPNATLRFDIKLVHVQNGSNNTN